MNETKIKEVFIWTGGVIHLVDPIAPILPTDDRQRKPALCGLKPVWPGLWWDLAGSDGSRAASWPVCSACKQASEATG